ncbi:MAG: S41 family peptidase [Candidatus Polarisedimenticolia bacterium]
MRSRLVIVLPLAAAGVWLGVAWARHDPDGWLREFDGLRVHMARHYANLDWMVQHRRMDLPALVSATERDLRSSLIPWQASRALKRFVAAFDDPHLKIEPLRPIPPRATEPPPAAAKSAPEPPSCDRFHTRDRSFRFPFEQAEGWRPAGGPWFPAGSFADVGVLRIALFGEDGYLEACQEVGPQGVRERLQEELRRTIRELRERNVRALVVDISGNGGGTEWVEHVTALLTSRTLTRPSTRMIEPECDRTPVWTGRSVCPNLAPDGTKSLEGEGVWDGPLALLVDGGTASASEDMVVWLRESHAATIIGERTYGAGCGYVRGGNPARLESIGWMVLLPNCARYTSDGINEVEGIDPDVPLKLNEGSAADRLDRLVKALPG